MHFYLFQYIHNSDAAAAVMHCLFNANFSYVCMYLRTYAVLVYFVFSIHFYITQFFAAGIMIGIWKFNRSQKMGKGLHSLACREMKMSSLLCEHFGVLWRSAIHRYYKRGGLSQEGVGRLPQELKYLEVSHNMIFWSPISRPGSFL